MYVSGSHLHTCAYIFLHFLQETTVPVQMIWCVMSEKLHLKEGLFADVQRTKHASAWDISL